VHPIAVDHGRITLTLFFADVVEALRGMRFGADAIYLDGFAPDRNPEMGRPRSLKALARLARPGRHSPPTAPRGGARRTHRAGSWSGESKGHGRKREMLQAASRHAGR
jgi:tRNA 5-methylaminomethyl-2-thiouridine biosynthesis bifunctional protein